jgi:hypothetical protein
MGLRCMLRRCLPAGAMPTAALSASSTLPCRCDSCGCDGAAMPTCECDPPGPIFVHCFQLQVSFAKARCIFGDDALAKTTNLE